jgi:polyhydroxyalkanoate synthesis repressor PhaR
MNDAQHQLSDKRLIKRYPNRRLYDTTLGHYTTLEDVRDLILRDVDVYVIEQSTGRDVTRGALLRVIAAQERGSEPRLTRRVLIDLIRSNDALTPEEFPLYLERQLQTANAELRRLSYELLNAQETERAHLARELHDDIGQTLAGLSLSMCSGVVSTSGANSGEVVSTWRAQIQEVLEHLRALTESLHPLALTQLGLVAAIQAHVARLRLSSGIEILVDIETKIGSLAPGVELTCFRIVQEALTNALKHSGAHTVWVTVSRLANDVQLAIRDNGNGFDAAATADRAIKAGRVGLFSMRERASLIGGRLTVLSEVGRGTKITANLPCQQQPPTHEFR